MLSKTSILEPHYPPLPSGSRAIRKPLDLAQSPSKGKRGLRGSFSSFPAVFPLPHDCSSFFPPSLVLSLWAWPPTGLVPISIGAQAIDPLTGEPGPVIGAQVDPSTGVVVPIVQVLETLPREVRDPRLVRKSSVP